MKELDVSHYIYREPRFDDIMCDLKALPVLPKAMVKEAQWAIAYARKFNEEVIHPQCLSLDRKMHENPDYLPWDFIKAANEWGFYTLFIPKAIGGWGINGFVSPFVNEEIAAACLSMANLIGVHYLGLITLFSTFNMRIIKEIVGDVKNGEKTGEPCLVSLAITEPGAGTDVEETDLIDKSNVACHAEKVDGGYVVNGSKIFISSGHVSTWHIVICYTDLKKPSENVIALAVKTGTKGFSFGRMEKKMGQKACPASELVFEDCFVPDKYVCLVSDELTDSRLKPVEIHQKLIDYVTSATRVGVGCLGSGVAKAAYDKALKFASETRVGGKLLLNHEWAQCMLAEMYKNWMSARLGYVEGNYANTLYTTQNDVAKKSGYFMNRIMTKWFANRVVSPMMDKPATTRKVRRQHLDGQPLSAQQCASGWASLSKFSGTDLGIKNCQMALQLMGQAGLRHDRGAEKLLRDSKLLQIYEGTNQLNRMNLFKNMIGRGFQQAMDFPE